nr:IS3 family transposase [Kistimonas asteriae]
MKEIFESSKGSYGSRRMSRALRALECDIARHKATRLMKEHGLLT